MLPRTALCYAVMGNQWVADMSQFREKRYEEDDDWQVPECIVHMGHQPRLSAIPTHFSVTGSSRP